MSTDVAAMPAEHATSWRLLTAAQNGDAAAFAALYRLYAPRLRRYLAARMGTHEPAEDLTSETFLRALRGLHTATYQGRDVGAWLTTIASNLLRDHRKSARHRYETPAAETGLTEATPNTPESLVLRAADTHELLRCLTGLTADQRRCLVLRFVHEQSLAATAAAMNRDVGAVKTLQYRAIRHLATLFHGA